MLRRSSFLVAEDDEDEVCLKGKVLDQRSHRGQFFEKDESYLCKMEEEMKFESEVFDCDY